MATAFRVIMTGSQEAPPRPSSALGLGTVIFDDAALTASYTIRVRGLDFGPVLGQQAQTPDTGDDVTSFHVHNAPRGVNGSVVFGQINPSHDADDLSISRNQDGSWTVTGRWETTDSPPATSISTFASQLSSAQIGSDVSLYFNGHTTEFTGGEIRGQWVAIANDSNNIVTGTNNADVLPGLGGDDIILGLRGNDRLEGGFGDDVLFGGSSNDTVLGGPGNDRLFGESGNDDLNGGSGNDRLSGGSGRDSLIGATGNDSLFGGSSNDRLHGGSDNDSLDGGLGNDSLIGANGNDSLIGRSGNDTLIGGSGNDDLNGGFGADILSGGGDDDTFTFNTALSSGNVDTIRAYTAADDTIRLENSIFTSLSVGALSAEAFRIGTGAADGSDRIIYDDQTGALYFDADGSDTVTSQVQFATLRGSPDLTRFDFIVF